MSIENEKCGDTSETRETPVRGELSMLSDEDDSTQALEKLQDSPIDFARSDESYQSAAIERLSRGTRCVC